ncbi:MAG: glycosyltransferase [bacterium]|nr:glycosyltransferase [bacterium]
MSNNLPLEKIVILYAPCGAGHKKAAEALAGYFGQQAGLAVEIKDILDFAPAWYRFIYRDGYYLLVKKFPRLWSLLYQGTELGYKEHILVRFARWIEDSLFDPFYRYLKLAKPTVLITTHFLPISLLKDIKRDFKFGAVITDYYPHSLWVSSQVDKYFVASDYVKQVLRQKGVREDSIDITGIPIQPIAVTGSDHKKNLFTVLILSGAGGVGDLSSIIKGLEVFTGKMQVIVSTGLNRKLQAKLVQEAKVSTLDVQVIGFTDKIYEYYASSDIVITKPGGLTVTECLTFGLPLIMINAIPGQEEENAKFVAEHQAGILVKDIKQIPGIIDGWLSNPSQLAAMKARALITAPHDSNERIFNKLVRNKNCCNNNRDSV